MSAAPVLPHPPGIQDRPGPHHPYVLIDCAQMADGFYAGITSSATVLSKSLFMGTPHAESAQAGPLFIEPDPEDNPDFVKTILQLEQKHPAIVWLWSHAGFNPIFRQLKKLLFGEGEDGTKMLLRFYDPRCLEGLLAVYRQDAQAGKVLDLVQAWAFLKDGRYQYLS